LLAIGGIICFVAIVAGVGAVFLNESEALSWVALHFPRKAENPAFIFENPKFILAELMFFASLVLVSIGWVLIRKRASIRWTATAAVLLDSLPVQREGFTEWKELGGSEELRHIDHSEALKKATRVAALDESWSRRTSSAYRHSGPKLECDCIPACLRQPEKEGNPTYLQWTSVQVLASNSTNRCSDQERHTAERLCRVGQSEFLYLRVCHHWTNPYYL
jgi:hypothetical protein